MRVVHLFSNNDSLNNKIKAVLGNIKYDLQTYKDSYVFVNHIKSITNAVAIVSEQMINNNFQVLSLLLDNYKLVVYLDYSLSYGRLLNVINNPRFILLKQNNIDSLAEVIDYAFKVNATIAELNHKNKVLNDKLDEQRVILKAKVKLMKEQNLTEDEAYKSIIREAMATNTTKGVVAKRVLERVKK